MFTLKELESLSQKTLKILARDLNAGGYSIPISEKKTTLIENIFNVFGVRSHEDWADENCSARIRLIRKNNRKGVV